MKRTVLIVLGLLFLSGCAQSAWENVNDTQQSTAVSAKTEHVYKISVELPKDISLIESADGWSVYATELGDFEIETKMFLASSLSSAIENLSGFRAEELSVLELKHDDLSEYRFAWVTNSEQGSRLCTADLMMDGMDCYAVVCSTDETVSAQYRGEVSRIFATYELLSDELV